MTGNCESILAGKVLQVDAKPDLFSHPGGEGRKGPDRGTKEGSFFAKLSRQEIK